MALPKKQKQPAEIYDYDIGYRTSDLPLSDVIATATASMVCVSDPLDTGLTLGTVTTSGRGVKVWLSSGTDGEDYQITVRATTLGGRVLETDFILKIREA